MTTEWYLQNGDARLGPFTPKQLRELATLSKLAPDDLVWRDGLEQPVEASRLKGLFDSVAPTPDQVPASAIGQPPPRQNVVPQPPSLPQALELPTPPPLAHAVPVDRHQITPPPICVDAVHDFSSDSYPEFATPVGAKLSSQLADPPYAKLQGAASSFVANAKGAGRLIAKQAERTKLRTVSIPNAYNALGKGVFTANNFRADLTDAYAQIDGYENAIKHLKAQAAAQPKAEHLTGRAKSAAMAVSSATQVTVLESKRRDALMELGRAAFERFGEQAGPLELCTAISQCKARLAALDLEIERLSTSKSGQVLTPKRLAQGGIAAILLVAGYFALAVFSGDERGAANSFTSYPKGSWSKSTQNDVKNTPLYQTMFKDGATLGQVMANALNDDVAEINRLTKTGVYLEREKNRKISEIIYSRLESSSYYEWVQMRDDAQERLAKHPGDANYTGQLQHVAGLADGFLKDFNANCKVYQIQP